jgi:hypothetical protein
MRPPSEPSIPVLGILVILGGIALMVLAPMLSDKTVQLFGEETSTGSLSLRPLYVLNERGATIGWWQIRLIPKDVMIGDTADLEITYAANAALLNKPLPTPGPGHGKQQLTCAEANALRASWGGRRQDCSPAAGQDAREAEPAIAEQSVLPQLTMLRARIINSDLPYAPQEDSHDFSLAAIVQSPLLSENHVWHLLANQPNTAPGRKSLLIAFQVQPASYQQREAEIGGQSVLLNGSELPVAFNVLTEYGLPRHVRAIFTAGYTTLAAICSSTAFLMVLRHWLQYRSSRASGARGRRKTGGRARPRPSSASKGKADPKI